MNRSLISLGAIGAFLVFAFGSAGGAALPTGNAGNVDACKAYIAKYNEASCLGAGMAGKQDEATMCPPELNMSPKDMAPYYNCMADAIACNGELPDASYAEKMAACKP